MTDRQARLCLYVGAAVLAVSCIAVLVLKVMLTCRWR